MNNLNSGYVGVLNDKNKFYLVNLNGSEREELIEFEKYIYEDMDVSIAELESIVNFEFGKNKDDLSQFKIYYITYTGRIFETLLTPSSFSLQISDFTSLKSLYLFDPSQDSPFTSLIHKFESCIIRRDET